MNYNKLTYKSNKDDKENTGEGARDELIVEEKEMHGEGDLGEEEYFRQEGHEAEGPLGREA